MPMNIRMIRDFPVSPNPALVEVWREGEVREGVEDQLATDLILDAKVAEEVQPDAPAKGKKG